MDDTNLYGRATGLGERGRHRSFGGAIDAALKDLAVERNDFFDSLADSWDALFPGFQARPGRYEDGKIVLYARSAPALFSARPRLRMVKARLAQMPNAPAKIALRLEIHAT